MGEEPSGLVGDAEHTVKLMGAHALLRGAHEVDCEQPLMNRDMRTLHNRASAAGELVAAVVAEPITGLGSAFHLTDGERATVRAMSASDGPAGFLKMGDCGGFVREFGGVNVGHG